MSLSSNLPNPSLTILLHGRGGNGGVMMPLVEPCRKANPSARFVAPDAPFASPQGGCQWFEVEGQVLRSDHVAMVRDAFDEKIFDVVKQEGFENALDRVAFFGISQGAIVALDAVASGRWHIGALVSFAGLLPLPPTMAGNHAPVLLIHGISDLRIPAAASMHAAEQLRLAGFDVTLELLAGVGHPISSEAAEKAFTFLEKHFANYPRTAKI